MRMPPVPNIVAGQWVEEPEVLRARELRREMTPAEKQLWGQLRTMRHEGFTFRRQQVIDGFIVNFYCHAAVLIVEVDGSVHDNQHAADRERDTILSSRRFELLRVTNEEVGTQLPEVLERIAQVCRQRSLRGGLTPPRSGVGPVPPPALGRGLGGEVFAARSALMNDSMPDDSVRCINARLMILAVFFASLLGLWFVFQDTELVDDRGGFCVFSPLLLLAIVSFGMFLRQGLFRPLTVASFLWPLIALGSLSVYGFFMDIIWQNRAQGQRMDVANRLKQIDLALHAYHVDHHHFPPPALRSGAGTPLLSWRVAILPYLNRQDLHSQFHLAESWDSPHNASLIAKIPTEYTVGQGFATLPEGSTPFQVFVGPGAAFEEGKELLRDRDFPDGLEKTCLVADARTAVPWTKPEDLRFSPGGPLPELGFPLRHRLGRLYLDEFVPSYFTLAMGDGTIRSVFRTPETSVELRTLITRNAGDN
jgi:very-short-patch-repair endonuclease